MNIKTRLKFTAGILGVVVLVMAMLLRLQYDMSKVASQTAQLQATSFTVGAVSSGIVTGQFVSEGDKVRTGEKLFELHSPDLATAITNNEVVPAQNLYTSAGNDDVYITAAADGIVQKINYTAGAFVPANSSIATIDTTGSTYVLASFKLTPPDYKALHNGNKVMVTLPDATTIVGKAYGITLSTSGSQLYTTVKVRVDQSKINRDVFSDGTPVHAQLYLDRTTWYASLSRFVQLHGMSIGSLRQRL